MKIYIFVLNQHVTSEKNIHKMTMIVTMCTSLTIITTGESVESCACVKYGIVLKVQYTDLEWKKYYKPYRGLLFWTICNNHI